MGIGGAPEGVITAAALRCLHGEMVARLVIDTPELEERIERMGIKDPRRVYSARDLAPGSRIIFAACGVTQGTLLNGVRFFKEGSRTHSLVMTRSSNKVSFVDTVHLDRPPGPRGVRLY
jgi:fructose-1,6-bisphosphatase/sedoheptulose 1,7-bisphosphatase-like protein